MSVPSPPRLPLFRRWLWPLAVAMPVLSAFQEPPPALDPPPVDAPAAERLVADQEEWLALVRRDARVSFTRRSGHDARAELMGGQLNLAERGAALMTIGCTEPQMVRVRPLLEAVAMEGDDSERYAAILALGRFGVGTETALLARLEDSDALARGCALLALALSGRHSSLERVQAVAEAGGPEAALAEKLLVQAIDPETSRPSEPGRMYYQLRWEAARRYGLIDGQTWLSRMLRDLVAEERFLDGVVLGAVADSSTLGVKDHLLSLLLDGGGAAAMRASVRCMPNELVALIESGLWKPRGVDGWRLLLDEVDAARAEDTALALLAQAIEVPEVEVQALMLLARAGLPEPLIGLDEQWEELSPRDKRMAARAWALAGDGRVLNWMAKFQGDTDPGVRAAVLLARARLGDPLAHEDLRDVLTDPQHSDRPVTLAAAAEQADAPLVRGYLEDLLPELEGGTRLLISTALARAGSSAGRRALGEELEEGFPAGRAGVRCVWALAGRDPSAHLDLYKQHFPAEDDLELNIALAQAITMSQDDLALRFLRPALWSLPFDRSVLAALAITGVNGIHGLRDELVRAPLGISTKDLRRVGFALGAWGGIQAVEFLQKKWGLLANDPVLQGAVLGALGRRTH